MIGFSGQNRLFDLIGRTCRKKTEALVIGGSAMLFYNFSKVVTKDIDLVLNTARERDYLVGALEKIGFRRDFVPKREGEPFRLSFGEYILDIFAQKVFRLRISPGMLGRVKEKVEFGNLTVSVISPEDIIISKGMTDRAGDREDAVSIIREANVRWDSVLGECAWQAENGDFRFCVYLYDFLDELTHDFGVKLPRDVTKGIKKMYMDFLEKIDKGGK